MHSLLRNFWNTLKRYKVASILNILGLSFAFAAFIVIMMQVRYDLTYDKFHTHYDRIYRIEHGSVNKDGSDDYGEGISLPMFRIAGNSHPDIVATARISRVQTKREKFKTNLAEEDFPFSERVVRMSPETINVFDFIIVTGDTARFSEPNTALISQIQAEKMFPGENPVGKIVYSSNKSFPSREIIGVYKDFPVNSYFKNNMYVRTEYDPFDETVNNINDNTFIRISSPKKKDEIEKAFQEQLQEIFNTSSLFRLTSLRDIHYITDVKLSSVEQINSTRTYLFLGIAVLIILIAVINFINFTTSLVPGRLKSVNTQKVLGQTTGKIRRNMIFEAIGICLISVLLSYWIVYFVSTTSFSSLLPADMGLVVNISVLLIAFVIAIVTGILAGIYPAFLISSYQPAIVLKGSFGLSPQGRKLRTFLIGFQYVISFSLIIVAIFMEVQQHYMKHHPMGYNRENVLTFKLNDDLALKTDILEERLRQCPDILNVGFSQNPIFGNSVNYRPNYKYQEKNSIGFDQISISPGLLATLGIELLEGREFDRTDSEKKESPFIINETLQKRFDMEVGFSLYQEFEWDNESFREDYQIIGISRNFNYKPMYDEIDALVLNIPNKDRYHFWNVYVRAEGKEIPSVIKHIQESLKELDPAYKNYTVQFIDETIGQFYEKEQKLSTLITTFSLLAVCISLIGVFGLVLFEIQYRRKEIGIRKIHGATIAEVLSMLNLGFVKILAICFIIAAPIAYYSLSRWVERFAYKAAVSVWIFAVAFLIVSLITILTVTLQSWRAATENPVNAIKTE